MPSLLLDIALSRQTLQLYYQGDASRLVLTSREGRRVNMPIHHLRPFVTHLGVNGVFEIEFNEFGKLLSLRRLS
ncbi:MULTISPECIES: DUF2835 domain-containing protein [Pseudomonas]|uniref:Topoisomerase II n=1 Tax=Pseudomonas segetis TaxID=298908 RepID=A0A238ZZR7_9PSED|nr:MULTISPECIES: DUF2835 domain-containing protein [Pseudomonas]SNR88264.1 Protein of unknown function [Pseudomonas segetis]